MTCIVAYDIEDDKIRGKLSRYLEGKGIRLQKSVFAVEIERHVFNRFLRQMDAITGEHGKVAVFRLCAGCFRNAIQSGAKERNYYVF